jgi:hypothetical protein
VAAPLLGAVPTPLVTTIYGKVDVFTSNKRGTFVHLQR